MIFYLLSTWPLSLLECAGFPNWMIVQLEQDSAESLNPSESKEDTTKDDDWSNDLRRIIEGKIFGFFH